MCHVLLKLADAFGAEGVRDSFSLAGMFGAIARVEEASLDGDKGIVVVAVQTCLCQLLLMRIRVRDPGCEENAVEATDSDYLFSHPPVWL